MKPCGPYIFALITSLPGLLIGGMLYGQCTVSSSYGWTVEIELMQTEAIPEFTDCPWYYHYEVGYDYNITFTGNPNNRSFNANLYFNCTGGQGSDPYAAMGNFTASASGSGTTANLARQYVVEGTTAYDYGDDPDCNSVGLADINCTLVQIDYWGSGITSGTIFCPTGFALPIELLDFSATPIDNNKVSLEWATATETNNSFFTVQKSRDGKVWEALKEVQGAGNSTAPLQYHFTDYSPYSGKSFYRLKQTDFDGSYSYSEIEPVEIEHMVELNIYPNPTSDFFTIMSNETISTVAMKNHQGQLVLEQDNIQKTQFELDVSGFAPGIYYLIIGTDANFRTAKVMVVE